MTEQEKAFIDKIENSVKSQLAAYPKNEELLALKSEFEKLKENKDVALKSELEKVSDELEKVALKLKAMEETPKAEKGYKTIGDALKAAFAEKAAEIKEIVESGGKQKAALRLELKNVGTMSVESTIGSGSTQVTITENTGIISTIRKREQVYLANVSVGRIGTNRAVWIEETDEEGTPIMLGEGDSKTQLDVQYVEQTMAVKKIAVYGKVTTELMADIPQLISYIQNNLMKRMDLVLEDQFFSGTGVGDELKGLSTYATAFSAPSALALQVADANEIDVLEAVALQVKNANGTPNAIFVSPDYVAKMKLIKDSAGRPVWKDYITIDGSMSISGMRVIESKADFGTDIDFIGGDLSVVNVLEREGLTVQIGLNGNDFIENKKTMLLERRMVQFVSANDTPVIVKGKFSTAITALDLPAAP